LIEARNMRDVAEADLRRVTGIEPGVTITIDAVLEGPAGALSSYDDLLADAGRTAQSARRFKPGWRPSAAGATRRRPA